MNLSEVENNILKESKSYFIKHGFIATYVIGKCRCHLCVERWDKWVEDAPMPKGPVPEEWDITKYVPYGSQPDIYMFNCFSGGESIVR